MSLLVQFLLHGTGSKDIATEGDITIYYSEQLNYLVKIARGLNMYRIQTSSNTFAMQRLVADVDVSTTISNYVIDYALDQSTLEMNRLGPSLEEAERRQKRRNRDAGMKLMPYTLINTPCSMKEWAGSCVIWQSV